MVVASIQDIATSLKALYMYMRNLVAMLLSANGLSSGGSGVSKYPFSSKFCRTIREIYIGKNSGLTRSLDFTFWGEVDGDRLTRVSKTSILASAE